MKKPDFLNISIIKYSFLVFSVFLICIGCNQKTDTTASNETLELIDPMEGVWEQTNYYFLANGDTIFTSDTRVQHKIYLDGYIMWTADPAPDSSEWHGYGTYRLKNDTLFERLLSMSMPMKAQMESDDEAILIIEYDENSFKQMIEQEYNDTVYQSFEVYKKLN